MTCTYIVVRGENQIAEPCGASSQGDYCFKHKKLIEEVDELDRQLQETIRDRQRGASE